MRTYMKPFPGTRRGKHGFLVAIRQLHMILPRDDFALF